MINNTSKDSFGSTNWRLDWARINSKSYASVVIQNTFKASSDKNKSEKIHKISHSPKEYSKNHKIKWSNINNDRASVAKSLKASKKINWVQNQSQKILEVDVIPTHNRFDELNNTDFNTNCASKCNAIQFVIL